ncbi:MAG: hypothetical protein ACRBN8_25075 [Nannocystales bacterium]
MSVLDVVAMGARTPVGLRVDATAAAIRSGLSGIAELAFVDGKGSPICGAADRRLEPAVRGHSRMAELQASALEEALGSLELTDVPCRLWSVLPETRPGFGDEDARRLVAAAASRLVKSGARVETRTCGRGHAGAAQALVRASAEESEAVHVVVGVDSYLHPHTYVWLEQQGLLAQEGARNGVVPGEAACCLVLASAALQSQLRVQPLARVAGAGHAREERLRDSESGSLGVGLTRAVLDAGAGLAFPDQAADAVFADLNGDRYRSEEWAFLALRAPVAMRSLQYRSPVGSVGDVGAAFMPLSIALAAESFARGYAPGPRALVTAGSHGGLRGAVFLATKEAA